MLTSAVGFTVIANELDGRSVVLVLARDVPAGDVLTAHDLRAVEVAAGTGVVPVSQRGRVLGRRARVPLVAGSLLSVRQVGERADYPPAGRSQVSLAVETGAAPPDLALGERVAVLPGPDDGAVAQSAEDDAGSEQPAGPPPVVGVVTGVKGAESAGGVRVVTVLVETGAVRRATSLEHPRIVVLSARGSEAP